MRTSKRILLLFMMFLFTMQMPLSVSAGKTFSISKAQLLNKIKGGWAAQTIGCTYGGPTEFIYQGRIIPDSIKITWPEGRMKWYYEKAPGLYDDIYMDLTFVEVFERLGLDAPADSFAIAFANAGYNLWHANQAARINILDGIMPPLSGDWHYNAHADCIDYQIEADYSGLMSPGMPNQASAFSDRIGHIMNFGDGWYGGVFVGAMYSIAFISDDIEFIVSEALKTIPKKSNFYKCIADVIKWCKENPDWKQTWQLVQDKHSYDIGCPEGIEQPLNINAVINSAYVVMGLLYGKGNFEKTIEIATRCGQDSDCNPATAGGILGTVIGYDKIPEKWITQCREVEDIDFAYTKISLNKAYELSYRHALQVIKRNGGSIDSDIITIKTQKPKAVKFEQSFSNLKHAGTYWGKKGEEEVTMDFQGAGFVVAPLIYSDKPDYVADIEITLDGKVIAIAKGPLNYHLRRPEVFVKYDLQPGLHHLKLRHLNPSATDSVFFREVVFYDYIKIPFKYRKGNASFNQGNMYLNISTITRGETNLQKYKQ